MAEVLTHNQMHATPQEALLHYGVKGMKWGVRKRDDSGGDAGPTKRDVKAGDLRARAAKSDIRAQEIRSQIDRVPAGGFRNQIKRNELRNELAQVESYTKSLNKTADAVEGGRLTPNQKKLLIGGALVGGLVLATYGANKVDSGELNALKLRGQAALRGKPFEFNKHPEFAHAASPDQVIANVLPGINPGYNTPGGTMNCRRATFAFELRRRGYDVTATTSLVGRGQSETGLLNALTPGQRNVTRANSLSSMVVSGAQGIRTRARGDSRPEVGTRASVHSAQDRLSLFGKLNEQPAGARGEAVFNFGAFGHSLAYEKFHDGSIHIFDSQKGTSYNVGDDASYNSFISKWGGSGYRGVSTKGVEITRLDDLDLDHNFLARWATNRTTPLPAPRSTTTTRRPTLSPEQMAIARGSRPSDMHITTWNTLRRKAGLA